MLKPGEAGMPFRLIQGEVIDAAESVDKLNFAALHGSEPWEICIVWDDCAECIVRVIWKDAEAYQVRIQHPHPSMMGCTIMVACRLCKIGRLRQAPLNNRFTQCLTLGTMAP